MKEKTIEKRTKQGEPHADFRIAVWKDGGVMESGVEVKGCDACLIEVFAMNLKTNKGLLGIVMRSLVRSAQLTDEEVQGKILSRYHNGNNVNPRDN